MDTNNTNDVFEGKSSDGNDVIYMELVDEACYYNHYLRLDDRDRVVHIWSDGPCPLQFDPATDVLLTDKGSYQFRFEEGGEENPPYIELDQQTLTIIPLYKYDRETKKVVRRTDEEIKADYDALDPVKLNMAKDNKIKEVSEACSNTISDGVDVVLTDGSTIHISLSTYDQINLSEAYNAVLNGAETVLYHVDGELFTNYSADDIKAMYNTANDFKMYYRAYINHLIYYIRSLNSIEEVNAVKYGDSLPDALNNSLSTITEAI